MFVNRPAMQNKLKTGPLAQGESPETIDALEEHLYFIRDSVQKQLITDTNGDLPQDDAGNLRNAIESYFNALITENNLLYNKATRERMLAWVTADIIGYGPLEPLLENPDVTEIMVNGHETVYAEHAGLIEETDVRFENEDHLRRIIDRIVAPLGRRIDESSPMVDARLPNGYRVNATIPPLSLNGPILTIRKFSTRPFTVQDLIAVGTLTIKLVTFLQACVEARVNMVISGGTGSGKTTMLNIMSSFIPDRERVITIEDTAELQLRQKHVVRLEKRPANIEGKGEVTIRQLVINSLRMRPDRIVVGECRGGESLDMLQAMNTGHDGSMTTVHSNGPRDSLRRIETMVLMAGMELPLKAIREQVASSVELIVHLDRLRDGTRRVVNVTEVQGMEGDAIILQDIFAFKQTGFHNGRVIGGLKPTGLRPSVTTKFAASGVELPANIFTAD
jgi:pilus assembly protein CpaF